MTTKERERGRERERERERERGRERERDHLFTEQQSLSAHAPRATTHIYVGLTDGPFKTRYNNNTSSFRDQSLSESTELSKYIHGHEKTTKNINFIGQFLIALRPTLYLHTDASYVFDRNIASFVKE